MEMTIVENLQRADLNPMEQARAFDRLGREFKMTQEQMAKRTGKDRATVANFLRLLRLPTEIQGKVEAGELSFGHARTLLALESPDAILKAAQKVLALSMSVRQTESFVQNMLNPEKAAKRAKVKRADRSQRARSARSDAARARPEGRDRRQGRQGQGHHRVRQPRSLRLAHGTHHVGTNHLGTITSEA